MTLFNLEIEGKVYRIDLYPEVRAAITRNMMALYYDYRTVNPEKADISFDEYLDMVAKQPHPENQVVEIADDMADEDDTKFIEINEMLIAMREQLRHKDRMIESLCDAIKGMK